VHLPAHRSACPSRFLPRPLVVDTYVVDAEPGTSGGTCSIVSMLSYYTLPSSVLGHREHTELRAAYMFYTGVSLWCYGVVAFADSTTHVLVHFLLMLYLPKR
jgi:Myristoyl-CoA:protein N-myristoyltransferase, C-terminal domain